MNEIDIEKILKYKQMKRDELIEIIINQEFELINLRNKFQLTKFQLIVFFTQKAKKREPENSDSPNSLKQITRTTTYPPRPPSNCPESRQHPSTRRRRRSRRPYRRR